MAEEEAEGEIGRLPGVERFFEQAGFPGGQGHQETGLWVMPLVQHFGRGDEGGGHVLEFRLPGARQQGKDGGCQRQAQAFAHQGLVRGQGNGVGHGVADVGNGNAGLLVEGRLHGGTGPEPYPLPGRWT